MSSLFVVPAGGRHAARPSDAGIVTERDVLRALASMAPDALTTPCRRWRQPAAGRRPGRRLRLSRHRPHEPAEDPPSRRRRRAGASVGALSARDLLRLRAEEAVLLGDEIDAGRGRARARAAPGRSCRRWRPALVAEGVPGRDVAAVISRELGALTRRAAVIAEARMHGGGPGRRRPALMRLRCSAPPGAAKACSRWIRTMRWSSRKASRAAPQDRWFAALGAHVADILHEVGVPYCKGGVMAKNPQWRGSVATWRERVDDWIGRSRPAGSAVGRHFLRPARRARRCRAGGRSSGATAFDAAKGKPGFAKLLADAAGRSSRVSRFSAASRPSKGRIDLKRAGLFGIVTTARVLAIRHHIVERATPARLAGLATLDKGTTDLEALSSAHAVFVDLILAQQIADIDAGHPPSNRVEVKRLSRAERARLKDALRATAHLDALTRDLLF